MVSLAQRWQKISRKVNAIVSDAYLRVQLPAELLPENNTELGIATTPITLGFERLGRLDSALVIPEKFGR